MICTGEGVTLSPVFFFSSVPSYSFSVMKRIDIPFIQFGENYLMERKVSDCRVLIGGMLDPKLRGNVAEDGR